ncbi:MAG: universal stress protein [Verrucomicrobiota bacterium]|jgi:nucleotide-binding universal stress UspA family protein
MKTKTFFTVQATATTNVGIKEILVPIDFSEYSVNALRHAAGLAAKDQAHLTLLNVVDEPVSFRSLDLPRQQRGRRQEHAQQLQELARRELGPNLAAGIVICDGNPSREITRVAARQHADLIVLGRHERHGLRRWFHGHTASRIIHNASCPVMVLNDNGHEPMPHKLAA